MSLVSRGLVRAGALERAGKRHCDTVSGPREYARRVIFRPRPSQAGFLYAVPAATRIAPGHHQTDPAFAGRTLPDALSLYLKSSQDASPHNQKEGSWGRYIR